MNIISKKGLAGACVACVAALLSGNAMAYSIGITISDLLNENSPGEVNRAGGVSAGGGHSAWSTISGVLSSAGNPWFEDVPLGPPGGLPPGPPESGLPLGPPDGLPPGPPNATPPPPQVIPVPAAIWLFGSALGLLFWTKTRIVRFEGSR